MTLKLITAPTTYPVTLADAKLHCKIDVADDDALLTALITAATEMVEQKLGRAVMQQTWEVTLDAFPDYIELTRTPVQSITSLKYIDTAGVEQTLGSGLYNFAQDDFGFARVDPVYGGEWPTTRDQINAVAVRYVAGYANAAAVPEGIKQWVKLSVSTMYENRGTTDSKPTHELGFADRLLDRYKVWS